ncbi:MAG: hypothetical protein AB1650_09415 [Candidatus Omnitrophota bacterium]
MENPQQSTGQLIIPVPKTAAKLSSSRMIAATIFNDLAARYWSLQIIKKSPVSGKQTISIIHTAGLSLKMVLSALIVAITARNLFHPAILAAATLIFIIMLIFESKERHFIKNTILPIIERRYPKESLERMSLFELSEKLSSELHAFSMVDLIVRMNQYGRTGLIIFIFIDVILAFKIPFHNFIIWAIISVYAFQILSLEIALMQKTRQKALPY